MERIVYILGAGFSAPAGIPTIRNFLTEANDLYSDRQKDFSFFEGVFERLDQLGHVSTFYSADLKNIEDVLSMLEMRTFVSNQVEGVQDLDLFEKFICAVIKAKTPDFDKEFHGNYRNWLRRQASPIPLYSYVSFVLSLHRVQFHSNEATQIEFPNLGKFPYFRPEQKNTTYRYDVVSLNYDRLLETSLEAANSSVLKDLGLSFEASPKDSQSVTLAKLHGDAGSGVVVCPTWNKSDISSEHKRDIKIAWMAAYNVLKQATQIRILGYSLPVLDSYIRYLLKAAIHNSRSLKKIDVLCLDPDGEVEARYKQLATFRNFKYISQDVSVYLNNCKPLQQGGGSSPYVADLEFAHGSVFGY